LTCAPDQTSGLSWTWTPSNHEDNGKAYSTNSDVFTNLFNSGGACSAASGGSCFDSNNFPVSHRTSLGSGLCCGNDVNEFYKPDYYGGECTNDVNDCVWSSGDAQASKSGNAQWWCYLHEWYECNSPADIGSNIGGASCVGVSGNQAWTPNFQVSDDEIVLEDGTVIEDGTVLDNGTVVEGGTVIENTTVLGDGTVLVNGILLVDATVFVDGTVLENAIVVEGGIVLVNGILLVDATILGDGTVILNVIVLDSAIVLDDGTVIVDGILLDDGTIVNARVLGDGTVLVNGILLGDGTALLDGVVLENATVSMNQTTNSLVLPEDQYSCTDGLDNDGDDLIDCQDPDCAGNINGRVLSKEGVILVGAQVVALQNVEVQFTDFTNSVGKYGINNVLCGTVNLIASADGYISSVKDVEILPKESITVNFLKMIVGSTCETDCTYAGDNTVHKECSGISGCGFYDATTQEICNLAQPGWIRDYGGAQVVDCAEGIPREKTETDVSITCEEENIIKLTKIVNFRGKLVKMVVVMCG